jgi:hypothetical protein
MKIDYKKNVSLLLVACLLLLNITNFGNIQISFSSEENSETINAFQSKIREDWWWTPTELITDFSTSQSYDPSMVIDSNNVVHLVWNDFTSNLAGSGSDTDIFYSSYDPSTYTWSAIEVVSSESTSSSVDPVMVMDNEENIHVIWGDSTDILGAGIDRDIFYKSRTPTGIWTTTSLVSSDSTTTIEHPFLAVDSEDNLHVAYYDFTDILGADSDADIFYHWLNSTTDTWSSSYLVSSESSFSSTSPKIEIAKNSGNAYILWSDYTDNLISSGSDVDIFYKVFNHNSLEFGSIRLVSGQSTENSYSPNCRFDSNNMLHIFWRDSTDLMGFGIDYDIFHKTLDVTTSTWVDFEIVGKESSGGSLDPFSLIDKEDRIYLVWQDSTDLYGSSNDYDIVFKYKESHSSLWSDIYVLSTLSDAGSSDSVLAIDGNGFVTCIWYDYSDMLSSDTDADLFFRRFIGTPSSPLLSPISPNPSKDGNISLSWKGDYYDSSFSIYRDTSLFSTTAGMEPIATLNSNSYIDNLNETGVYYYGVVSVNEYGLSDLSNIEDVEFEEEKFFDFFSYMNITEILTLVGILLLSQIVISVLVYLAVRSGNKGSKRKGKKKK